MTPQETEHKHEPSVLRITREASFCCQSCGSGAERYADLFKEGTCQNCGAGAKEYTVFVLERDLKDMEKTIFLVHMDDVKEQASQFAAQMRDRGVTVITLEDVLPNGVRTEDVPGLLQFAIENVAWVFVMPSTQLERSGKGGYVENAILSSMMIEDQYKVVPVYTDTKAVKFTPHGLVSRRGVLLSEDGGDIGPLASGLGDFLQRQLPRMIPREDYQKKFN